MSTNIGELLATLGADTRDFDRAMKRSVSTMQSTGKQMKNVGKSMSLYLTAALVAVGAASFNMGKDFEASMSKIVGLVGIAQETVDDWAEEIIAMGPDLAKGPLELADALFFVTSAGIRGAEAMDVLTMAAKASTSGLGETKVVADLVTSAMNAYGKDVLTAANATDILVATVKEGKAEAPALVAAMGQVLPIASEMSVSFDQVGAAIAAMTRTGTDASTASIQLRQILASILKPSQQAEEALSRMGSSTEELKKIIADDGLVAALAKLKVMTKGNSTEMAKVFPNIRALSGVLDIMGKNAEDNVAIFDSLTKATGSLDNAFTAATDTVKFKWNKAIAEVKTAGTKLGLTLGQVLVPMLEKVAQVIAEVSTWYTNLSKTQQELVIKVAGFVAVLGPLLVILGTLITAISTVGGALLSLAGPVGIVLGAIALLTAGYFAYNAVVGNTNKQLVQHKDLLEELGGTTGDLNAQMVKEELNMQAIFDVLKKTNPGTELRKTLIDKINTEYGKYLPNLLTEKSTLEDIRIAEESLVTVMRAKLAERFKQQKMNAIIEAQIEREQKVLAQFATEDVPLSAWIAALGEFADKSRFFMDEHGKLTAKSQKNIETLMKATGLSYNQLIPIFQGLSRQRDMDANAIADAVKLWKQYQEEMSVIFAGGGGGKPAPAGGGDVPVTTTPDYLKNLQMELDMVGLAKSVQEAMTIARQNDIEIGSEQYKQILKLTTAIEANKKALEDATEAEEMSAASKERLEEQTEAIQESVLTQEESIRLSYANRIEIIKKALEANIRDTEEAAIIIAKLTEQMNAKLASIGTTSDTMWQGLMKNTQMWTTMAIDGFTAVGTVLGKVLSGAKNGWMDLVTVALKAVQQIITMLLAQAIAGMISNEVSKKGVIGLGIAAVGIAALSAMWATYVSKKMNGLQFGGDVTTGGNFVVGERGPEILNLPVGAAVTPMNKAKGMMGGAAGGELSVRVTGRDLEFVLDRWAQDKERIN